MKVAIIGGTGYVGSYVCDELIKQNHTPRILVREGSESKVIDPENNQLTVRDKDIAYDDCSDIIFNRKYHYHNKFLNLLLIFWLFIFISSIFSEYKYLTLKPSITFIRFILFSFALLSITYHYKTFLEN